MGQWPTIPGYAITRVAGTGGMGVVYDARDRNGQRVALKVVAPDGDGEFARRFEREIEIAEQLHHDHIVRILDAGPPTADTPAYLAMAYIEGRDLDQTIRVQGRLDPGYVCRLIDAIAAALDEAHAHGLVHRDVKPANVLLGNDGGIFLSDFGLTRPIAGTRLTATGVWLGTVDYAAPEQIKGESQDARTDIYALACLCYHALSGTVAFPRDSDMAKLWAHVHDDRPRLPHDIASHADIDAVIARGMATDPDDRHPSAGDFARALWAAVEGRAVEVAERSVATGAASPSRAVTTPHAPTQLMVGADARTVRAPWTGGRERRWWIPVTAATLMLAGGAAVASAVGLFNSSPRHQPPSGRARTPVSSTPAEPSKATAGSASVPSGSTIRSATAKRRPVASAPRADDLPIALDPKTDIPTRVGSWNPKKDPTIGAAVRSLGSNYTITSSTTYSCVLRWDALGITVEFDNYGSGDTCADDVGLAQTVTIDSTTDRWRTLSGLRPGMRETAVPKLYPKATRADDGEWWIVTAYSQVGSGAHYPALAAETSDGRIAGFKLAVGAAGD